jgi:hypothetical protein
MVKENGVFVYKMWIFASYEYVTVCVVVCVSHMRPSAVLMIMYGYVNIAQILYCERDCWKHYSSVFLEVYIFFYQIPFAIK